MADVSAAASVVASAFAAAFVLAAASDVASAEAVLPLLGLERMWWQPLTPPPAWCQVDCTLVALVLPSLLIVSVSASAEHTRVLNEFGNHVKQPLTTSTDSIKLPLLAAGMYFERTTG